MRCTIHWRHCECSHVFSQQSTINYHGCVHTLMLATTCMWVFSSRPKIITPHQNVAHNQNLAPGASTVHSSVLTFNGSLPVRRVGKMLQSNQCEHNLAADASHRKPVTHIESVMSRRPPSEHVIGSLLRQPGPGGGRQSGAGHTENPTAAASAVLQPRQQLRQIRQRLRQS